MHPSTEAILKYFEHDHLPPHLSIISEPFCDLAKAMASPSHDFDFPSNLIDLPGKLKEGPELTMALRKLLEAKDCAVRAAL